MSVKTGYMSGSYEKSYTELVCSYCNKHLGVYERISDKEYNDTEGWNYCPYCGTEL